MALQRDKVINAAEKLVARGKIEPAIREYERLLDDNPNDVNTLNRIGDLWVRINRNDEAIKSFRRIALRYAQDGYFLKAIAINKKMAKLDPFDLTVHATLADLYGKQGLATEAKSQYVLLADAYLKNADLPNALTVYLKIADLDPRSINVRTKLAELYALNGRASEARVERGRLTMLLIERGLLDEAQTVFKKDANLGPVDPKLAESLATAFIAAKNHRSAIEVLTTGLRDHKGDPALTVLLGEALTENGDVAAAIDLLEPLIEEHPQHATARRRAADAYLKLKNSDAALRILNPLIDQALAGGDPVAAARVLQRIVDADPSHEPTRDRLGSIRGEQPSIEKQAALLELLEARSNTYFKSSRDYIPLEIEPASGHGGKARDGLEQLLEWSKSSDAGTILLSGQAGSGKTTLLGEVTRHLTGNRPTPIYIPLAEIGDSMSVDELLRHQLSRRDIGNVESLRRLLARGEAVLLLDGLDEIRSERMAAALVDDILASSRAGQTKVMVTTRNSFVPDVAFSGHFRLSGPLHERIRLTLRQRVPEADRWLDLLVRLDLFEACHDPQILRIVCDFAEKQGHDAEETFESSRSGFFQRLIEFECHKESATRGALQRIAGLIWRGGSVSASEQDIINAVTADGIDPSRILLGNRLLQREEIGRYSFIHSSIFEWLIAANAADDIRHGNIFGTLDIAPLSPAITELLFEMLEKEELSAWIAKSVSRPASPRLVSNRERILAHLGRSHELRSTAVFSRLTTVSAVADAHEEAARELLSKYDYDQAVSALRSASAADPGRAVRLATELGFLLQPNMPAERLRWCADVWKTVTRPLDETVRRVEARKKSAEKAEPERPQPPAVHRSGQTPQRRGDELEEAAVRLFKQFFALTEDEEGQVRVDLQKLRRQKPGAQYGYDLAFEAEVAETSYVRCHVECKNYSSSIALKDIADKLLQQKSHGVRIDHWILISPHSDPSQDLHHFLEYESEAHDFPFDIHVWSPETNVEQFFGLEPLLHEKFYADAGERRPAEWSLEERSAVVERYRRFLRPVYRLPAGWHDYVATEKHLCFSDTEQDDFELTYQKPVALAVRDRNGVELRGTAIEQLMEWLGSPVRVALVLAEFGDGKSFLTYSLSRHLLQAFRADPASGFIPLRFALREFATARNVREFLEARLELFGAEPSGWRSSDSTRPS